MSIVGLPPGACDAAVHVYQGRHRSALNQRRSYDPAAVSTADLRAVHGRTGIERAVIVQPTTFGTDHGVLFEALAESDAWRGVMLADASTTEADIAAAHAAGVCGVRFNLWRFLGQDFDRAVFDRVQEMVAPYGWHTRLHLQGAELAAHEDIVRAVRGPVLIDHMAHMDLAAGPDQAPMRLLLDLLREDNVWVMLSNYDRWSPAGPPDYADALPYLEALMDAAPDRCVWATDWPHIVYKHPDDRVDTLPDHADLLRTFLTAAGSDARAEQALVRNPSTLFGWDAGSA